MTQPGAPAPDSAPQPQPRVPEVWQPQQRQPSLPEIWPPQQQVGPPWAVPPQVQGQPPLPPRADSTRTIAIIALVISGLTLLGIGVMTIAPFLFFGALAFGAAGFGDVIGDGSMMSSSASYYGGDVTPAADGSVTGTTLAAAVTALASDNGLDGMAGRVTCDPVPHVGGDVSVLCRATDPAWYGIVRFSGSDGSFDVLTMGGPDASFRPNGPNGPDGPMP